MGRKHTPTPETVAFAKEAIRMSGVAKAGLLTDHDVQRLERMAERAQQTQTAANSRDL